MEDRFRTEGEKREKEGEVGDTQTTAGSREKWREFF